MYAAARRPSELLTYEAFTFGYHDVLGLTVALASNRPEDGIETWPSRWDEWNKAIGSEETPVGLLGQCAVFFALGNPLNRSLYEEIAATLQPSDIEVWPETTFRTRDRLRLWEGADRIGRRVVVVVAPSTQEEPMGQFVWWRGLQQPAGLTRYLLHGTKLRYEHEVFLLRRQRLRASGATVDGILEELLERYREPWPARAGAASDIVDAQRALGWLRPRTPV